MTATSLWSFISNASPVVKFVLLILITTSIISWTLIIQRFFYFRQHLLNAKNFENQFWSKGSDIFHIYSQQSPNLQPYFGLNSIFYTGFKEFQRVVNSSKKYPPEAALASIKRAMQIVTTQEITAFEKHLNFLATVGSTSPYIGLFGTVWGIMSAFRALGIATGQATLTLVAPGIAEALIATAIGLFVAIPAVIAYNRLSNEVDQMAVRYEKFQEELTALFHHQIYQSQTVE